jgi:hypothetical protein
MSDGFQIGLNGGGVKRTRFAVADLQPLRKLG